MNPVVPVTRPVFHYTTWPREVGMMKAVRSGFLKHGIEMQSSVVIDDDPLSFEQHRDADLAIVFGCKGLSRQVMDAYRAANVPTMYLDKGYTRTPGGPDGHTRYSRFAINSSDPTAYFMREPRRDNRVRDAGFILQRRRTNQQAGSVIFLGGSQNYCAFHGLGDATEYAKGILDRLKTLTDRELIYRPKPSWTDATPIEGVTFSGKSEPLSRLLRTAHCVVAHGSNATAEAIMAGVPAIVLGNPIAAPVAELQLSCVERPEWPGEQARRRWLSALTYTQFTWEEIIDGTAWGILKADVRKPLG